MVFTSRMGSLAGKREMIVAIMDKEDVFDRIMKLPGIRVFQPVYNKYKEILLYIFFGGLTTVISIASYWMFNQAIGINELIANVLSWILSVLFAFVTNLIWVFQVSIISIRDFLKQILSFYEGRLLTLALEEVFLFLFITILGFPSMITKIFAQVVVMVGNYVISKCWVFKKEK